MQFSKTKKKSNAHSTNFTYEMLWTWTVHLMTTKLLHKHCAHIKICALHRLHYHIIHLNMQPFHRTVKWMNGNGKRSWVVNDENSHNMQTTSCSYHTISYHFHNSTQFYSEPLLGPGLLSLPPYRIASCLLVELKICREIEFMIWHFGWCGGCVSMRFTLQRRSFAYSTCEPLWADQNRQESESI